MNKIKVSTVKMNADVQVIGLDAYFIAKAVRCVINTEHALSRVRTKIENGPEDNMYSYDPYELEGEDIEKLFEALDFLKELTEAFLGEEKPALENKESKDANVQ